MRQPSAAIVQAHAFLAEPIVFGHAPEDIARIMPFVQGWDTFSVPRYLAHTLERTITTLAGTGALNTLEDVYHVLDTPIPPFERRDDVRLLTDNDMLLMAGMDNCSKARHTSRSSRRRSSTARSSRSRTRSPGARSTSTSA